MDLIASYLHDLEVPKDELTSLERTTLYGQGKPVDRIPASLDGGETMSYLVGAGMDEYYFSSEIMAQVEEYIHRKFGSDGAGISTSLRGMAKAMGSEIKYSKNNVAQLAKPALRLSEVDNAKLVNVDKDGRLPIILDAVRKVKERLGDRVSVSASVTGSSPTDRRPAFFISPNSRSCLSKTQISSISRERASYTSSGTGHSKARSSARLLRIFCRQAGSGHR